MSPLPWKVNPPPTVWHDILIDDAEGNAVLRLPLRMAEIAPMIVRAVNSHAELVAALEELVQEAVSSEYASDHALQGARSALAKVKGTQ